MKLFMTDYRIPLYSAIRRTDRPTAAYRD